MADSGIVIVDKPAGMTSHDVVARLRRLAGTRRVGHAGTLDPMATGVLVVGLEKATRLLGYLMLTQKQYTATIRLGETTDTDDADGEVIARSPAANVGAETVQPAIAALTGQIQQVPPGVSAIKVGGKRAYRLARAGEAPELAARAVTVQEFTVQAIRHLAEVTDVDVTVTCSSGTYIRALARDLGAALRTGGHLTALRRTRVGPYQTSDARSLEELAERLDVMGLADAASLSFPCRKLTAEEARVLSNGGRLAPGVASWSGSGPRPDGPVAAISPDGALIALIADEAGQARPVAVFAG